MDQIPKMQFNGVEYYSAFAPSASILPADTTPIGTATRVDDQSSVSTRDVLALSGVDPSQLVVMKSADPANGAYILFWREGAVPRPSTGSSSDSTLPDFVRAIPGLCAYFPQVGC